MMLNVIINFVNFGKINVKYHLLCSLLVSIVASKVLITLVNALVNPYIKSTVFLKYFQIK